MPGQCAFPALRLTEAQGFDHLDLSITDDLTLHMLASDREWLGLRSMMVLGLGKVGIQGVPIHPFISYDYLIKVK